MIRVATKRMSKSAVKEANIAVPVKNTTVRHYGRVNFDDELQWAIEILNNTDTRIGATKMLELHEIALSMSNSAML